MSWYEEGLEDNKESNNGEKGAAAPLNMATFMAEAKNRREAAKAKLEEAKKKQLAEQQLQRQQQQQKQQQQRQLGPAGTSADAGNPARVQREPRDPQTTLHIYTMKGAAAAAAAAPDTQLRASVSRPLWEEFHVKCWQRCVELRTDGQTVPKVKEYEYSHDHGIITMKTPDDLARMRPIVEQVSATLEEVTYNFKGYVESELPSVVQLTIRFNSRKMLPSNEPKKTMQTLLDIAAEDNNWPTTDTDGTPSRNTVVEVAWAAYLDGLGKQTGKGYWLVRFRVNKAVAEFIRTKQNGVIEVVSEDFRVFHQGEWWCGDRAAALTFESGPWVPEPQGLAAASANNSASSGSGASG